MSRTLMKSKGRRVSGPFIMMQRAILDSSQYAALSPRAVKLLYDVFAQFRGANNGDLSCAFSVMRPRGWLSKDQLAKARRELIDRGWLGTSRKPRWKKDTELFYLTFLAIDDCKGKKLDLKQTTLPTNDWKNNFLPRSTGKRCPQHGQACLDKRSETPKKDHSLPALRARKDKSLARSTGPFLDSPKGVGVAHQPVVPDPLPPEPEIGDPGPWVADI